MMKIRLAKGSIQYFIVSLLLITFVIAFVSAQNDNVLLPAFYYGGVTLNGEDVQPGAIIVAKINDKHRGEIQIADAGRYGSEGSDDKLLVLVDEDDSSNDQISFWLRRSGYQDIQAQETATWISGSVNDLDLTFVGDNVQDTGSDDSNTSDDSGDSDSPSGTTTTGGRTGRSGGGGGGGTASLPSATVYKSYEETFLIDRIEGGQQIDLSIKNDEIPITKIQLILKEPVDDVQITVGVTDDPNADKADNVFKYISIDAPKITDDNVELIIISFKVPNAWFDTYDEDEVVMIHWNSEWQELETVPDGSGVDATHHYFRAESYGFSYFAISSLPIPFVEEGCEGEDCESAESDMPYDSTDMDGENENAKEGEDEDVVNNPILITGAVTGDTYRTVGDGSVWATLLAVFLVMVLAYGYFYFTNKK